MQKHISIIMTILMGFILGSLFASATGLPMWSMIPPVTGSLFLAPKAAGVLGINLTDLTWSPGELNVPGVKSTIYYAPKSYIASWPTLPADATSAAQEVTLEGAFTMESGKYFKTLYTTQGKGKVEDESQGEDDCRSFLTKASFSYPGTKAEALAFCKLANNDDYVYLIEDISLGKYRVVGNEDFRTNTKTSVSTGDSPTGVKGVTINVEVISESPAYIFAGTAPLEP